jgi:hypothetical protein
MRDHLLGYPPAAAFEVEYDPPQYTNRITVGNLGEYPLGVPTRVFDEMRATSDRLTASWRAEHKKLMDFERNVVPYPDGSVPVSSSLSKALKGYEGQMTLGNLRGCGLERAPYDPVIDGYFQAYGNQQIGITRQLSATACERAEAFEKERMRQIEANDKARREAWRCYSEYTVVKVAGDPVKVAACELKESAPLVIHQG